MSAQPRIKDITIEKSVYRGFGLGYLYGKPTFLAHAYPGEHVSASVYQKGRKVFRGTVLEILDNPSPFRREPPCPYSGRCGGCHYQEIVDSYQLETKRAILEETLRYIGKLEDLPEIRIHPSPLAFRYRPQCGFQVKQDEEGVQLGYFEYQSQRFLAIDDCLLLYEPLIEAKKCLERLIAAERDLLAGLSYIDLRTQADSQRITLTFGYPEALPETMDEIFERVRADMPHLSAILFKGWKCEHLVGDSELHERVGDLTFTIAAGSFFQNNRSQWPVIQDLVLERMSPLLDDRLLDLFCGVGFWSVGIGRHCSEVLGIEGVQRSVDLAGRNAADNGLQHCRFEVRDLSQGMGEVDISPSLVLINPPRSGCCKRLLNEVAALGPRRIVYVSCDPPSLARDVARLKRKGSMRIESVDFIDMFPQTFSIETAITLVPDDRMQQIPIESVESFDRESED